MNVPDPKVNQAERAARRARAYLCEQLGLAPDASDDHIRAKDSAAVIPTSDQIISEALDAAIEEQERRHWERMGELLGRALKRADRPVRLQVFALLGLGDLD